MITSSLIIIKILINLINNSNAKQMCKKPNNYNYNNYKENLNENQNNVKVNPKRNKFANLKDVSLVQIRKLKNNEIIEHSGILNSHDYQSENNRSDGQLSAK